MKDAIKAMIQKQIAQHEANIAAIRETSIDELVEKEVAAFREEATAAAAKRVEGQIAREYMYVSVLREVITGIDSMESEDKAPETVSPTVEVIDG